MKTTLPHRIATSLLALLALIATGASAGVIVTNDEYRDFDKSSGYISFDVKTHGLISDLDIAIEFSKCDNPYLEQDSRSCIGTDTPYENEIVFQLIGPGGRTVRLVDENTFEQGSSAGVGRITMTFTDEGLVLGKRVQAGSFQPVQSLSLFDGLDMFGEWKLFVADTKGSDPLEIYSSRLIFSTAGLPPQNAVPEPATLALFGAGLIGLSGLAARRRRR